MNACYEIMQAGKPVGKACVSRQGLYLCFSCRCEIPDGEIVRLIVESDGHRESLGVCVPMGNVFGVETKLPAKKIRDGNLEFYLEGSRKEGDYTQAAPYVKEELTDEKCRQEQFIPVSEEQPFEQLDLLNDSHMEIRDGEAGIVIQVKENVPPANEADGTDDQISSSSPTGQ